MRIKRIGKVQRLAFRLQVWNVEADTVERQNGIIAVRAGEKPVVSISKKMQFSVNTSLETGSEKSKVSSSCQVII